MKRIRQMRDEIKRKRTTEPKPSKLKLLVRIGKLMDKAENTRAYSGFMEERCIVCSYKRTFVMGDGKATREIAQGGWDVGLRVEKRPYFKFDDENFGSIKFVLLCGECAWFEDPRYNASNLNVLHAHVRMLLWSLLPQPIFDEVWPHLGWEKQ
jgi:hypothetical protein